MGESKADLSPLFSWRGEIVKSGFPFPVKGFALILSLHMNEMGGSCFPSIETMMRESSLSERTVREHLRVLADAGWLSKRPRFHNTTVYEATFPPGIEAPSQSARSAKRLGVNRQSAESIGNLARNGFAEIVPNASREVVIRTSVIEDAEEIPLSPEEIRAKVPKIQGLKDALYGRSKESVTTVQNS